MNFIKGIAGVTGPRGTASHSLGPCDVKKDLLIKDIYDKSVILYYLLADNAMRSCGHLGILGPDGGTDFSSTKATLESAIQTIKICLDNYKERIL